MPAGSSFTFTSFFSFSLSEQGGNGEPPKKSFCGIYIDVPRIPSVVPGQEDQQHEIDKKCAERITSHIESETGGTVRKADVDNMSFLQVKYCYILLCLRHGVAGGIMLLGDSCPVRPFRPVRPIPSRPPKASHIFLTPELSDIIFGTNVSQGG